jgi:hypothetical protein
MLYSEIIAVCSEIHTKHINILLYFDLYTMLVLEDDAELFYWLRIFICIAQQQQQQQQQQHELSHLLKLGVGCWQKVQNTVICCALLCYNFCLKRIHCHKYLASYTRDAPRNARMCLYEAIDLT